jgi:hypothetical protein
MVSYVSPTKSHSPLEVLLGESTGRGRGPFVRFFVASDFEQEQWDCALLVGNSGGVALRSTPHDHCALLKVPMQLFKLPSPKR